MGIFDSLKNMTNQAVKNNVSKAVSGAVNNAMHKSKTFVFADYPKNADELKKMPELDFSSPLSTAAFAMLVLLEYDELPDEHEEPDEPDELEPDELLEEVSEGVLLDLPCESK